MPIRLSHQFGIRRHFATGTVDTDAARDRPDLPMSGRRLADMRTSYKWFTGVLVALSLCFVLFVVEASVGHDGLLCELGYDKDGDGDGVTGCA